MLEHSRLMQLLKGNNNPLWICNIPDRARATLGCSTGAVYLSTDSAKHILEKHNNITDFDLLMLPIAIERGNLLKEKFRNNGINSIYETGESKIFFVALKVASKGHELWVSSMYRIEKRQIEKKYSNSIRL